MIDCYLRLFYNTSSRPLPIHTYWASTGPTGWYLYFTKGAPLNLQAFATQVPPGSGVLLVTRYPPGTTFTAVNRVFRCGHTIFKQPSHNCQTIVPHRHCHPCHVRENNAAMNCMLFSSTAMHAGGMATSTPPWPLPPVCRRFWVPPLAISTGGMGATCG